MIGIVLSMTATDVKIQDNTDALARQLKELGKLGYDRVMLVTHSTGGILALQTFN